MQCKGPHYYKSKLFHALKMASKSNDGESADDMARAIHFPSALREVLDNQPAAGLAAPFDPMQQNTISFDAVQTGSITQEDSISVLQKVKQSLEDYRGEHREDGYNSETGQYFDRAWRTEEQIRQHLINSHPEYRFIMLVAGASHKDPTVLFKREALDQNSRRILQRAATVDAIRKEALKNVTEADKSIKSAIELQTKGDQDIKEARSILSELSIVKKEYTDTINPIINAVNNDGILSDQGIVRGNPLPTLDEILTLASRCKYPREGLDSTLFVNEFIRFLTIIAVKRSEVAADDAQLAVAKNNNPTRITISAIMCFLYTISKTPANLHYAVEQMNHAGNVFPRRSVYARTPSLFEDDVMRFVEAATTKSDNNSKKHVTWVNMSINVWISLNCIRERWYGIGNEEYSESEGEGTSEGTSESDESEDGECGNSIPNIEKPSIEAIERRGGGRSRRLEEEDIYGYGEADENSSLYKVRKKKRTTTRPEEYQRFLIEVFLPLFLHGFSTLFYDVEKLRHFICEEDVRIKDALRCRENAEGGGGGEEEANDKILFAKVTQSKQQTLVRLEYFFGGLSRKDLDIYPNNAWPLTLGNANQKPLTPFESFYAATISMYKKSLSNEQDERVDYAYPLTESRRDIVDNADIRTSMEQAIQCGVESLKNHYRLRKNASYQLSGATEAYENFVKQSRAARETFRKMATDIPNNQIVNFLAGNSTQTFLTSDQEEALLQHGDSNINGEVRRRSLRKIISKLGEVNFVTAMVDPFINSANAITTTAERDQTTRAEEISKVQKGLVNELMRSLSVAGAADEAARDESIEKLISRLKKLLSATHVDSVEWSLSPHNTGVLMLSPQYISSVDVAYQMVQENAPNLANCTLEDLKLRPSTQVIFAELVAHVIARTESLNPRTLQLNRFTKDTLRHGRSILTRMRRLDPIKDAGLGTGMPNSTVPKFSRSSAIAPNSGHFQPRNEHVMGEEKKFRINYETDLILARGQRFPGDIRGNNPIKIKGSMPAWASMDNLENLENDPFDYRSEGGGGEAQFGAPAEKKARVY